MGMGQTSATEGCAAQRAARGTNGKSAQIKVHPSAHVVAELIPQHTWDAPSIRRLNKRKSLKLRKECRIAMLLKQLEN